MTSALTSAACLPARASSAIRSLSHCGSLFGKRVLVTGELSGGVGRFAVQLAHQGGATVVASVGLTAHGAGLVELGADQVVIGLEGVSAPIDIVIDNVGGLNSGRPLLARRGRDHPMRRCGVGQPTEVPRGGGLRVKQRSLVSFYAGGEMGPDIAVLLDLDLSGTAEGRDRLLRTLE